MFVDNINYAGKYSFDFFSPALYNNEIFRRFSPFDGVKNSITLPKVSLSGHVVPDSCDFDPAGSITLDPRVLTVCGFKVNEKLCAEDVEASFLSERLRNGANTPVGPEEFTSYILDQLQMTIQNNMQNVLWNGDAGATGGSEYMEQCDGLITMFETDNTVVGITGTTAVTSSNVISVMSTVYAAIPATVKSSGAPLTIFVAQNVADAYKLSQISVTGGLLPTGDKALNFLGIEVVAAPYMPANNIVVCDPRNIAIGTDLLSDMNSVQVIDTRTTLAENAIRIAARWKFGVQYRIGAEIVWYHL